MQEEKEVGQVNDVVVGSEEVTDVTVEPIAMEVNSTHETQELNPKVLDILPSTEVEGDDR